MIETALQVSDGILNLWESFDVFVGMMVLIMMCLGIASRSMAIGAFSGFITFAYIAINVDVPLYTNIFYVTLTLAIMGLAFKIWRLEASGGMSS